MPEKISKVYILGPAIILPLRNLEFWFKTVTQEDPELTSSCRHTKSTAK